MGAVALGGHQKWGEETGHGKSEGPGRGRPDLGRSSGLNRGEPGRLGLSGGWRRNDLAWDSQQYYRNGVSAARVVGNGELWRAAARFVTWDGRRSAGLACRLAREERVRGKDGRKDRDDMRSVGQSAEGTAGLGQTGQEAACRRGRRELCRVVASGGEGAGLDQGSQARQETIGADEVCRKWRGRARPGVG